MNNSAISIDVEANNKSSNKTQNEQKAPKHINKIMKKWIVFRLTSALTWISLFLSISGITVPIIGWRNYYLIIPSFLVLVVSLFSHYWLLFLHYIVYLIVFPFWVLFFKLPSLIKYLQIPILSVTYIIRFLISWKMTVILFCLVAGGWYLAITSSSPDTQVTSALTAHTALYLLFLLSFRLASNPYSPILKVIDFLENIGRNYLTKYLVTPSLKESRRDRKQHLEFCENISKLIEKIHQPKMPLRKGLTAYTHGNLFLIFTFVIIFIYSVLASSFALTLYKLETVKGRIIEGIGDKPSLVSYFYFSFLSQATAVPDGIKPISTVGELWIIWNVLTGILLLTVLITLFTSSVGIHGERVLSEINDFFKSIKEEITIWELRLKEPNIETTNEIIEIEVVNSDTEPLK